MMKRVLLLLPTTSYQNHDFLDAAANLDVDIIAAANYCHQLAPLWGMSSIQSVHFDQPEVAVKQVLAALRHRPDAVLAVDDSGLELAALLSEQLRLPANLPAAIHVTRDKLAFRRLLRGGGLNCPDFYHHGSGRRTSELQPPIEFPVVVKARRLSASRGVIRADTLQAFNEAVRWVQDIQAKADRDAKKQGLVVESFIPGRECALEGLLQEGRLRVLALFDKPDPLDGPYFEETLYITPSRLGLETQEEIRLVVQHACKLAGLGTGPIHAEMRLNGHGIWLLEIAARSIGGLCGRMLKHTLGMSLEELILRHALDLPLPQLQLADATGVMMIPIPRRGIFLRVHHLKDAMNIADICDIQITAHSGQTIAPPPEGASYLGFLFARARSPNAVEWALRQAHRRLVFDIQPEISVSSNIGREAESAAPGVSDREDRRVTVPGRPPAAFGHRTATPPGVKINDVRDGQQTTFTSIE